MLFASFTSLFWAVQSYAEKRTVDTGISRQDFFFYSCLSLLPFAAVMLFLTPFYFTVDYILILTLLASLLFRYGKMTAIVSTVEHLAPYESEAYMCLGVLLAYIIDCVLGVTFFSHWGVLSIVLALLGVFLIADVKLQIKKLRKSLIVRIVCDVGLGYCARYALLYCSNAMYILLLNAMIVLIWGWRYKFDYHKENRNILKLVIVQQLLGFICLFLGNIVAQQSVTAYALIRPMSLTLCVVAAFFHKNNAVSGDRMNQPRHPKIRDAIAIALIISGLCLQTVR